jgi:hypothetical protein
VSSIALNLPSQNYYELDIAILESVHGFEQSYTTDGFSTPDLNLS